MSHHSEILTRQGLRGLADTSDTSSHIGRYRSTTRAVDLGARAHASALYGDLRPMCPPGGPGVALGALLVSEQAGLFEVES